MTSGFWEAEGLSNVVGKADAICMDVPWRFKSYTAEPGNRAPERHYRTMTLPDIAALPVRELAAKDCHLMFWTTGPFLQKSFALMEAYGFRYSSVFTVWLKLRRSLDVDQLRLTATQDSDFHVGLGLTTRKNAEYCLLGRKGSPKRWAKDVRELILEPVREHSRKPDEFRRRVDRYIGRDQGNDAKVVELFARSAHPGWVSWGDEINRF